MPLIRLIPSSGYLFNLGLDGIERLRFAPVGKNNSVSVRSEWPYPHFLSAAKIRIVDKNSFSATWNISALATNAQQQMLHMEEGVRSTAAPRR
jgi:inner membrane protein